MIVSFLGFRFLCDATTFRQLSWFGCHMLILVTVVGLCLRLIQHIETRLNLLNDSVHLLRMFTSDKVNLLKQLSMLFFLLVAVVVLNSLLDRDFWLCKPR